MTTATNSLLADAFLAGVQNFQGEPYNQLLDDRDELITANMVVGALLADLETRNSGDDRHLSSLGIEAVTFAHLVNGHGSAPGTLKDNRREQLECLARGIGSISQTELGIAVVRVRAAMGIGSARTAADVVRSYRAAPGTPIQFVQYFKPEDVLKVLMEYPRTQEILNALQPESRLGAQSVTYVLSNGVAIQIEAQAPRPSSQGKATQLYVSIFCSADDDVARQFLDLRKRIFESFVDDRSWASLFSAASWTMRKPERYEHKIILSPAPLYMTLGVGKFDSWLSVELPVLPENFEKWLFYFLQVHLENGVFEFRPTSTAAV